MALQGVKFESGPNQLQQAGEDGGGSDAETADSDSIKEDPMAGMPKGITTSRPLTEENETKDESQTGQTHDDTTGTSHTRDTTKVADDHVGVAMSREELLAERKSLFRSGLYL